MDASGRVRNPFEVVRIPLQEVTGVSPDYKGLVITLANRTGTTAWAVQKSNLASWLHMHARADDVAETILAATREARGSEAA